MIIDQKSYLKEIKSGVASTDKNAERKIRDYMSYLVTQTTYKKSKIIQMTKTVAADYFSALPDEIADKQLAAVYESIKKSQKTETRENKTITLYESEMKTIADLKDDKLMRLAFAVLILHKYNGLYLVDENKYNTYKAIAACDADVYKISDLSSLSSVKRDQLWNQLCNLGLVKWYVKTNPAYRFNRKWLAIPMMSVTFNCDLQKNKSAEKVFMRINDYDNILFYLRLWLGDDDIIQCSECGRPIVKNVKSKCLCEKCADNRKQKGDNLRYKRKIA